MNVPDAELWISAILVSDRSRASKAQQIAEVIHGAGTFRWVGIYDVTPQDVRILGFSGPGPPAYPTFPREAGLTGKALRLNQTVVAGDVSQDPAYLTAFSTTRSEIIVLVRSAGAVVGTLDVESDSADAFSDSDRLQLERVAEQIVPLYSGR